MSNREIKWLRSFMPTLNIVNERPQFKRTKTAKKTLVFETVINSQLRTRESSFFKCFID
jgi:hypothetical protein